MLERLIPRSVRGAVRREIERRERRRLFGELESLVPPVEKMFDGPAGLAEFKRNGEEFFGLYRSLCDLTPYDRILDVGCGIGRKTLPLLHFLGEGGRYDGIDPSGFGIAWCDERITPRFPAFRFHRLDVRNRLYNPQGRIAPAEVRFPFEDVAFTLIVVNSVFTHMLPDEVAHYLGEIRRLLGPDGRCLASFFLLNEESRAAIASGRSALPFLDGGEGWSTTSIETPETAVAIDEDLVRELVRAAHLEPMRVHPGSWSGRPDGLSFQDLTVLRHARKSSRA